MVKIGEVEFLVKFDTIGKSFKDIFEDALDDIDFGVDEELMNKVNQIWFDLKQQYRITGTDRTFAQFIHSDLENIRKWWSDEKNIKQLARDIMASARGPAALGVPEEEWGEEESIIKKVEMYRDLLFSRLEKATKPEYFEKYASNLNQFLTAAERIMGSKNIVENIGKFNLLIDEFENVTKQITDILDDLEIGYLAKGHGGERYFQIQYADVGKGEKPISAGEFFDRLIKDIGAERVEEMIKRTSGIPAPEREDWKDVLRGIFEEYYIPKGQAIPIPIAKLLAKYMIDELEDVKPEDIYRGRGANIRTAEDILVFFKEGEGEDFYEAIQEAFGEGWEKTLDKFGISVGKEGGLLIEAKRTSTAEVKPEFDDQIVIAGINNRIDERFQQVNLHIEQQLEKFDLDEAKKDIIEKLGKKISDEFGMFPGLLERVNEEQQAKGGKGTLNG